MDKEHWKVVPGFNGAYKISSRGRVSSEERPKKTHIGTVYLKKRSILQGRKCGNGHLQVVLYRGKEKTAKYIHVLMAEAFMPKPNWPVEVNHKNGIKTDNRIDNLEWCTHMENMHHAIRTGLIPTMKRFSHLY